MPSLQHCKEKRDWTKLGALYLNARTGCEHFDDLQKLFSSIAEILARDSETDRPEVPFCDFADSGEMKMQEVLFVEFFNQEKKLIHTVS